MFRIETLTLYNLDDEKYTYSFSAGLNYFVGSNSTGKTVFYNFIDYMFGSSASISKDPWFRGSLKKAEMEFTYCNIKYKAIRTIDSNKNFFGYSDDINLELVNEDLYKERMNSVFTPDEETLKEFRKFVEEDISYRTFTLFNFLGETRQGVLNNFFDKCDKVKYSVKLPGILNYIFNDNLNEIASIRKKLEKLDQEIRDLEHKQTKYLFVLNEVNSRLAKLDINKRYTGDNASAIRKELSAIKNMENRVETKMDNIAVLETVYNNLSEQIRVYENAKQDSKQLKKNSENQKLLLEKLNDLIEENGQYRYLIEPIHKLIVELNNTISFSEYLQKDETIDVLKKQMLATKKEIRENDSRFICYSVEQKAKYISVIEELLDDEIIFNEDDLKEKKKQKRELKEKLRILQNTDNETKLKNLGLIITELYSTAHECSEVVGTDCEKKGFTIKYFKNGNVLQPSVIDEGEQMNYYTGSMARHTLMQLSGYLGFLKLLLEENKYPIIPFLVIDHISKPFDKDNSLAIGKIFEKAFEYIGKDDLQVFLFDDEMSGDLGLTPDHEQSMTEEGKTGFNPFYKP